MAFDWSSAKTKADYKSLTYEDIEKYCQDNNRIDSLFKICNFNTNFNFTNYLLLILYC